MSTKKFLGVTVYEWGILVGTVLGLIVVAVLHVAGL